MPNWLGAAASDVSSLLAPLLLTDQETSPASFLSNQVNPTFIIDFRTQPMVNDVIITRKSGVDQVSHTLTLADIEALPLAAFDITYTMTTGSNLTTVVHERAGERSAPSNSIDFIVDITAPTITSADAIDVDENLQLAYQLTASESVTWSITGGADAARFVISGSMLTWVGNGIKSFESPNDANLDNVYQVEVLATDIAGNPAASSKAMAVTVNDVVEAPTVITFRNKLEIATNQQVHTATALNIGTATDDLIIGLGYANTIFLNTVSLTVDGFPATPVVIKTSPTEAVSHAELWSCPSQGNSTPTIVATLDGISTSCGITVWTMTGHGNLDPVLAFGDIGSDQFAPGQDTDFIIPTNGAVIGLTVNGQSATNTWSDGLAGGEDFDNAIEGARRWSGAHKNFTGAPGTTTVTVTPIAGDNNTMTVFASWGP